MDEVVGVTVMDLMANPEPLRPVVCGELLALSLNVKVPVREPEVVGVKTTETVQLAPPPRVAGVVGQLFACI